MRSNFYERTYYIKEAKKEMKRKKFLVALLSTVMLMTCLSSCGGGGDEGSAVAYDDGKGENVLRITYDHECESGDPRQTTSDYIIPVSYTHLDVYKRQVIYPITLPPTIQCVSHQKHSRTDMRRT